MILQVTPQNEVKQVEIPLIVDKKIKCIDNDNIGYKFIIIYDEKCNKNINIFTTDITNEPIYGNVYIFIEDKYSERILELIDSLYLDWL